MINILTIFRKEVASFFNSLIAYLVLVVFLVGVGLFFWVFGDNVLITGRADMDDLFTFAPWFFLFLIPALTMRSFSEEMKTGTLELLSTRPVTDWQIILGKFFASWALMVFALVPTLVYYISLSYLGNPPGNLDGGPILGAYLGMICLGGIFTSIGIFSSTLTENQIVSFILSLFLCFFFYTAFDFFAEIADLSNNSLVLKIGINEHYRSISRGVVDTRDLIYFFSFIVIALILSKIVLSNRKK